jgi:acyl dehydratase
MADQRPLAVGDEIPPFERNVDLANWNRYAAVNDEFVPIHMDDDAGRAAGNEGAFGMGNLGVSYIHNMLRAWLGGRGRIRVVDVEFRRPSPRGALNRARGVVTAIDGRQGRAVGVELDVWIEDGDGQVLTKGTATVERNAHE